MYLECLEVLGLQKKATKEEFIEKFLSIYLVSRLLIKIRQRLII
ncbi:MAG: hypothetical protein ACJAYY_000635 [Paraglaciecola sp.]|jgi:hypothetical protein